VALVAIATHALFVSASLIPGWRAEPLIAGDAITYVTPARNLLANGHFSRDTAPPYRWEPYRTPGYSLVLAASLALTGGVAAALYLSSLTAGLAAWSAARLASEWGGPPAAAWAAGLMVALLPNSLGLSARVLTDALFGHLLLFWLYLLWNGLVRRSAPQLVASAAACAALQSLKPTATILGLVIVGAAFAVGGLRSRVAAVVLLVVASLPAPLYFSFRNLRDHDAFTSSILGVETFRDYCQMRYLARREGVPEELMMGKIREADRKAAALLVRPKSWYGRIYVVKRAEAARFIREHPFTLGGLLVTEMARQLAAPQEFAQTLFVGELRWPGRGFGSLVTVVLFGLAAAGGWLVLQGGRPGPALLVGFVLFLLLGTGAVSHFVGGRFRLPGDLAAAPLAGIGAVSLGRRTAA
jgi:hypothetical protein